MLDDTKTRWPLKPLSEVVDLNPRLDKSGYRDDLDVSFVPMAAVEAGSGRMEGSQTKHFSTVKKGYTPFRESDVLFAKITPCMENGKMAVVPKLTNGLGFGSTEFHVLRPHEGIDPRFVYYFISSQNFRREAAHRMTGAVGQKRVPQSFLEEALIPVPLFDDQKVIVAEIEKQFSCLDEAVASLKRVKANLKRYKASVLKAAVEGKLAPIERPWRQVLLGDIATSIRNGYSKKPDADQGTRIFRISAVRPMELDANDVRYLSGSPADYQSFLIETGDVLFTRYNGSRDYVGVCARVPVSLPPTVYPDKLIRVRVPGSMLLPEFLVTLASAGRAREYIESKIRTTAGQSGISGGDLKSLPLDIPSLGEQEQIVAEVERRLSVIDELEAAVEANLTRADRLRQSILQRAFSGKLVSFERSGHIHDQQELHIAAESPAIYRTNQ